MHGMLDIRFGHFLPFKLQALVYHLFLDIMGSLLFIKKFADNMARFFSET